MLHAEIIRKYRVPTESFFLFGPRGTGKSTWLRRQFPDAHTYDLLKSSTYLPLERDPSTFAREVSALPPNSWVVVDEVQRLPQLLNEVQALMLDGREQWKFVLTGSSARKLKREHANLLAGRALTHRFFPLTLVEIGDAKRIPELLQYGSLPRIVTATTPEEKVSWLEAYVDTYLREEVQQEALVRSLGSFHRFLEVASLTNGEILNLSNIARDVGIARSTVQGYFEILTDTWLGWFLPAFQPRLKVKEVAHPKFYGFDAGVVRTLTGEIRNTPSRREEGRLFETWVMNEIRALIHIQNLGFQMSYWRTADGAEVDLILSRGSRRIGVEIKSGDHWKSEFGRGLTEMLESGAIERAYCVFRGERQQRAGRVDVVPVADFFARIDGWLRFEERG